MGRGARAAVITLGVILALLVVIDRVGVLVAQNRAESKLATYAQFGKRPTVRVHGVPFLTQVIRGKYRDIEITGPLVSFGDFTVAALDVDLRGAHLPLSTLTSGAVRELPVDRADGTVTVPYPELAKRSRIPGLTLSGSASGLAAGADLSVPALGTVHVTGRGNVALDGNEVRVTVTELNVGSLGVPSAVIDGLQRQLTAGIALPQLPLGLRLTSLTTTRDGLVVSGSATDIVLRSTR